MAAQARARRPRRLGVHCLNAPGVFRPSSIPRTPSSYRRDALLLRIFLTLTITWVMGCRLAPGSGGFGAGRPDRSDLAEQAEPELGTRHNRDDHEEKADEHQYELPERVAMPAEEPTLVHPVAPCSRRLAVADCAPPDRQAGRGRRRQLCLEP